MQKTVSEVLKRDIFLFCILFGRPMGDYNPPLGKSLSAVFLYDTLLNKVLLNNSAYLSRLYGEVKNDVLQN